MIPKFVNIYLNLFNIMNYQPYNPFQHVDYNPIEVSPTFDIN
jgi:hypothetical protein